MTIDEVGPLLYGPSWRKALAAALGVSVRTVIRWEKGENLPRAKSWRAIAALLRERRDVIAQTIKRLPR